MVNANFKDMKCKCACCEKAAIMELTIASELEEVDTRYPLCEGCLLEFLKIANYIKKIMGGAE